MIVCAQTAIETIVAGRIPEEKLERENGSTQEFTIGVTLTGDFDDNALNDIHHAQPNALTVIAPHGGFAFSRSRYKWKFDYEQGLGISHPVTAYNSQSHVLGTALQFRISKRLILVADEHFLESSNPFDRLLASEAEPTGSASDRPNNPFLTSAQTRSEQAGLAITYALSARSTISTFESFFSISQGVPTAAANKISTKSASGHLVYSRRMARRDWVGLEYGMQGLNSWNPASHAFVESFFCANTLMLTANSAVSFAAGPERTKIREESILFAPLSDASGNRSNWRWGGNATYQWNLKHTTALLTYSHRISSGERLVGIVRSSDVSTQVQHRVTREWYTDVFASYHRENSPGFVPLGLAYTSIAGGFKRTFNSVFSVSLIYWRIHELQDSGGSGLLQANHNRLSVFLTYDLNEPIWK